MEVGEKYNWTGQEERLVYIGYNFSGNGYWHQFAKTETPHIIWCELLETDLHLIEKTKLKGECYV